MDYTTAYNLVDSRIRQNVNDLVNIYKLTSAVNPTIYRDPNVSYEDPVEVLGVVRTSPDMDMASALGKLEKDDIKVTFARKELETKFPTLDPGELITTQDVLEFEGIYYSIHDVKLAGRIGGGFTTVVVCGKENPDKRDLING